MNTYNVSQILGTNEAILRSFGVKVFEYIEPHLEKGESVTLSLKGLNNANFPFFSGLIGTIYTAFPKDARTLLHFSDVVNLDWQEDLNEAVFVAAHPEEAKNWSEAMSSLQY